MNQINVDSICEKPETLVGIPFSKNKFKTVCVGVGVGVGVCVGVCVCVYPPQKSTINNLTTANLNCANNRIDSRKSI